MSCRWAVEEFSRNQTLPCVEKVKLDDGLWVKVLHMELLTDLLGADKQASPALFCPVWLPEAHLALIKIPSVLLMQKSSSWAAARVNALGSSCARPAVSGTTWTNRSQTSYALTTPAIQTLAVSDVFTAELC